MIAELNDDTGQTSISRRYRAVIDRLHQENRLGADPLLTADKLRSWIFRHTPRASGEPGTLCTIEPFPYETETVLARLREEGSGYWCAGHAALLVCAYRDLGLRSAVMAFGLNTGFTHAVTAVEIDNNWYLQDPYTNARFAVGKTDRSSFSAIQQALGTNQPVRMVVFKNRLQPFIFCDKASVAANVVFPFGTHNWGNGLRVGLFHVSSGQYFQHDLWPESEMLMVKNTGSEPLAALFCHPLWMSDPKHGYYEKAETHPFWAVMSRHDNEASLPSMH